MFKTTLAGLFAHKLRLLLTSLAITLGVGFIAGTFVLTDTIDAGFNRAFAADAAKVDVVVLPRDADQLPRETLDKVRAVPGVRDAQPVISGDAPLIGKDGKTVGDAPTSGVSIPASRLNVTTGRAPAADGQAVLDKNTAKAQGFEPGDTISVLGHDNDRHDFHLVGVFDPGVDQTIAYRGAVGFTSADACGSPARRASARSTSSPQDPPPRVSVRPSRRPSAPARSSRRARNALGTSPSATAPTPPS